MCSSAHGRIGYAVSMLWQAIALKTLVVATFARALSACSFFPMREPTELMSTAPVNSPNPNARRDIPMPTRHFGNVSRETEVLGQVQVLFAQHANTFSELARRYDLGYQEMRFANPTVDPWLPGAGTPIYLPTMTIIPDASRDGIIVTLQSMGLLHFASQAAQANRPAQIMVTSNPTGIGREGWTTLLGASYITKKNATRIGTRQFLCASNMNSLTTHFLPSYHRVQIIHCGGLKCACRFRVT
jgi:hypothetical protein